MAKTLVIYYSRKGENYVGGSIQSLSKGNTEYVADALKKALGADLFEVETVKNYSSDYMTCTQEAMAELKANARPALKAYLKDISTYDNIVVCGPCWWGTYPMAVFSQLDLLDFKGKKVFPIMTHEGSGQGQSVRALKEHCVGAFVGEGLAIRGSDCPTSEAEVAGWARRNCL
jgi:flavodoxin